MNRVAPFFPLRGGQVRSRYSALSHPIDLQSLPFCHQPQAGSIMTTVVAQPSRRPLKIAFTSRSSLVGGLGPAASIGPPLEPKCPRVYCRYDTILARDEDTHRYVPYGYRYRSRLEAVFSVLPLSQVGLREDELPKPPSKHRQWTGSGKKTQFFISIIR